MRQGFRTFARALAASAALLALSPAAGVADPFPGDEGDFTRERLHAVPWVDRCGALLSARGKPLLYRCGPKCAAFHPAWHDAVRHRAGETCIHGDGFCAPCDITGPTYSEYSKRMAEGAREGALERARPKRRERRGGGGFGNLAGIAAKAAGANPALALAAGDVPGVPGLDGPEGAPGARGAGSLPFDLELSGADVSRTAGGENAPSGGTGRSGRPAGFFRIR